MKNEKLQEIINKSASLPNKELANILVTIEADFSNVKKVILELTNILTEMEITYDTVYNELQKRLKFEDKNES